MTATKLPSDKTRRKNLVRLQSQISEGLASGTSSRSLGDLLEEARRIAERSA